MKGVSAALYGGGSPISLSGPLNLVSKEEKVKCSDVDGLQIACVAVEDLHIHFYCTFVPQK